MKVNVFFVNPLFLGGQTTFTVHLMRGLRAAGAEVRLFKIGKRTERRYRPFGYGEIYQNVSVESAIQASGSNLITATSPKMVTEADKLVAAGFRVVIHDPTHLKQGWHWQGVARPIVIRRSMLHVLDRSIFLPHPYDRIYRRRKVATREWAAVSIARITSNKHPEILLDANRLLSHESRIRIFGAENQRFVRFWLLPKYPEWIETKASRQFPKDHGYAVEKICHRADFTCDMSTLDQDGGGTQYTFFEAIDAGSCLVLNSRWLTHGGQFVAGRNCLAVGSGPELAALISCYRQANPNARLIRLVNRVRREAWELLKEHEAIKVAALWLAELTDRKSSRGLSSGAYNEKSGPACWY